MVVRSQAPLKLARLSSSVLSTRLFSFDMLSADIVQRAEMRMVRWMCGVKLKDRLSSKELRERLGIDDIALKLRVQGQEEDQRGPGDRLSERTVKLVN